MKFDYSKLQGRIREKFKTQSAFAKAMNLSCRAMSSKLNNKNEWTQKEIVKACALLEIALKDNSLYFFVSQV